jgi:hypothetical protein
VLDRDQYAPPLESEWSFASVTEALNDVSGRNERSNDFDKAIAPRDWIQSRPGDERGALLRMPHGERTRSACRDCPYTPVAEDRA